MERLKYSFLFLFALSILGCEKTETFNNTDTQVGHSRVVFFPTLETKGERLIIINQGTTYTDAGANALLNGAANPFTTTGTVNTAVPGVYVLRYSTSNPEGFSTGDFRTVVVMGTDIAGNDFSGTYARYVSGAPNGQTSTWTKTANGVYTVVNPGGATGVTATVVNYSGNNIAVPLQLTSVGEFYSTGGVYNKNANPPQYQWTIINATYGNAVRTFVKQ
ncbi:MAG TPA: immunoglobulin-like domain-containing protein [Chitinophagaceae bacterium]|jgi:hypothetical protein|nr:immunoglobulin-like domain-containing protein [Chitinophagaceae bacterium]